MAPRYPYGDAHTAGQRERLRRARSPPTAAREFDDTHRTGRWEADAQMGARRFPKPACSRAGVASKKPKGQTHMKRHLLVTAGAVAAFAFPSVASAQSGHFITGGGNAASCMDLGTTVSCDGKVAGLGGTTFEITIEADGIASVECTNPGGNVAPGQDTAVTVEGTTDPQPTPRNGQFVFTIATDDPEPLPPTPTCPNDQWTPNIVDVAFTEATLSLFEDGVLSDQVVVPVS